MFTVYVMHHDCIVSKVLSLFMDTDCVCVILSFLGSKSLQLGFGSRYRHQHLLEIVLHHLPVGVPGQGRNEPDPTAKLLVARQPRPGVLVHFVFRHLASVLQDDARRGQLGFLGGALDTKDGAVGNLWVQTEDTFEFGRGDLEAADFDQFLCRVGSVSLVYSLYFVDEFGTPSAHSH